MDTRDVRKTRLLVLSKVIEEFAAELTLEQDELKWALEAYSIYDTALLNQMIESAQKNEYSKNSQSADTILYERYVILKELLLSRLPNETEIHTFYGIDGAVPYNRRERYQKAKIFLEANDQLIKEKNPKVLPQLMIDNLRSLLNDAHSKYKEFGKRKENSSEKTNELNDIFNEDSSKLRNLYNWVVAFWGKRDVRLFELGFVPIRSARIGENLQNIKLVYSQTDNTISWQEIKHITAYQLAMKDKETANEWFEVYNGNLNSYQINNLRFDNSFKLRVKNEYGFSNWSPELEIII